MIPMDTFATIFDWQVSRIVSKLVSTFKTWCLFRKHLGKKCVSEKVLRVIFWQVNPIRAQSSYDIPKSFSLAPCYLYSVHVSHQFWGSWHDFLPIFRLPFLRFNPRANLLTLATSWKPVAKNGIRWGMTVSRKTLKGSQIFISMRQLAFLFSPFCRQFFYI